MLAEPSSLRLSLDETLRDNKGSVDMTKEVIVKRYQGKVTAASTHWKVSFTMEKSKTLERRSFTPGY